MMGESEPRHRKDPAVSITATARAYRHTARTAALRARITAAHADLAAATIGITSGAAAVAATGGAWETIAALTTITGATIADRRRVTRQARQLAAWHTITSDWPLACEQAKVSRTLRVPERTDRGHRLTDQLTPPRVLAVRVDGPRTILTVRPHTGQTPRHFETPTLAHALHAHHATARRLPKGRIEVTLHTRTTGGGEVKPSRLARTVDLASLPVARNTITGDTWHAPLLGSHLLIAGNTRAGKSGAVWSIIRATGPAVPQRLVRWHVVDPKGGMELAPGRPLFASFTHPGGSERAFAHDVNALLTGLVHDMTTRADQLRARGHRKLETPTPDMPLEVVLIDEILSLRAGMTPADAKTFDALLKQLLAMGAAVGYSVIVATQDVRKESGLDAIRDLIPTRVCLRVADRTQVDMTLGAGAHAAGAAADSIDYWTERGVAYVGSDRGDGFARVRFEHVTDDTIRDLCGTYGTRQPRDTRPLPTTAPSPVVDHHAPARVVQIQESAPDAEPLVVPRLEAWEGGEKRSKEDAAALLDALCRAGRPLPRAADLAAWAGYGLRWGQLRLKDHGDCASHERTAVPGDRPLAAEPTANAVRARGANGPGVSESDDAPDSDTGDPAGAETLGADGAEPDERRTA